MDSEDTEYAETVKAIQAGIESHERGEGVEAGEAFEVIRKQLGSSYSSPATHKNPRQTHPANHR